MTERRPYVTVRTFADPTPEEALKNIYSSQFDEDVQETTDLTKAITTVRQQLEDLNRKRKSGVMKREERRKQRGVLVPVYKALLQVCLSKKGGK